MESAKACSNAALVTGRQLSFVCENHTSIDTDNNDNDDDEVVYRCCRHADHLERAMCGRQLIRMRIVLWACLDATHLFPC